MGVKAFTKAAVSDLKGKPQRGLLRSFKYFEKLTTVRGAKRILDDRPVCADSALRKLCKSTDLRTIGWHTLRHTFASHLAMRGVPLPVIKELMGHDTITTTMRYAHVAPSTLRAAIEMLNPKTMITTDLGQPVVNQWQDNQKREIGQQAHAPKYA